MARPIWKGYISFGLVAIPIQLFNAEKKNDLRFHLLDSRDQSRVHYERINAETGEEVPWDQVVKAYEFKKNQYVILDEEDIKQAAPEGFKSIDIEEFVDLEAIDPIYFERPYYIIPDTANHKAYVLLHEALKKTKKVGVAKVVIRTRQYLAVIMACKQALLLNLIRFPQEVRKESEFDLPKKDLKSYRISDKELKMAIALIKDMSHPWKPEKYHDEYRESLLKWIEKKKKTGNYAMGKESEPEEPQHSDEVIDFMSLLKESLSKKKQKEEKNDKTKKKKKAS